MKTNPKETRPILHQSDLVTFHRWSSNEFIYSAPSVIQRKITNTGVKKVRRKNFNQSQDQRKNTTFVFYDKIESENASVCKMKYYNQKHSELNVEA